MPSSTRPAGRTLSTSAERVDERADAVVVGARCAGSATAIALARAGRRVVVLDRAAFPSDTLSTHLLWAGGVAELKRLGALERVGELGAPRLEVALGGWSGYEMHARYTPVDGIDYGLCVRRPGLDAALVETARAAGAEVREHSPVLGLISDAGRVAGVRWRDAGGDERELAAPLVVGADGRRSPMAEALGVAEPVLESPNGRGCYFGYWRDVEGDWRRVAAQWRSGGELGTAFPCDGGLLLVLLMPAVSRAADFAADLEGEYRRTIAAIPELAARLEGCALEGKVRHTTTTPSYFRHSSGPGWALAGDAGHFKDPVTAQGIRDALHYGRLLGDTVAPTLGDRRQLDRALRGWERQRNRGCLDAYRWTNRLARSGSVDAIEAELYREGDRDPALAGAMLDVFSRTRRFGDVLTPGLRRRLMFRALRRGPAERREAIRIAAREVIAGSVGAIEGIRLRTTFPR